MYVVSTRLWACGSPCHQLHETDPDACFQDQLSRIKQERRDRKQPNPKHTAAGCVCILEPVLGCLHAEARAKNKLWHRRKLCYAQGCEYASGTACPSQHVRMLQNNTSRRVSLLGRHAFAQERKRLARNAPMCA